MTVMDGFNLWLGKVLAETAVSLVVLAVFVFGCAVYVYWPRSKK